MSISISRYPSISIDPPHSVYYDKLLPASPCFANRGAELSNNPSQLRGVRLPPAGIMGGAHVLWPQATQSHHRSARAGDGRYLRRALPAVRRNKKLGLTQYIYG